MMFILTKLIIGISVIESPKYVHKELCSFDKVKIQYAMKLFFFKLNNEELLKVVVWWGCLLVFKLNENLIVISIWLFIYR